MNLRIEEAAARLKDTGRLPTAPHRDTVLRWIHSGWLPALKYKHHRGRGGIWLIDSDDLDAMPLPTLGRPRREIK